MRKALCDALAWPRRNWVPLAACALAVLVLPELLGTACLLRSTTGLPCPGCGGTRAVKALLFHRDIIAAWRFHPLIFIAPPMLAAMFLAQRARSRFWVWFFGVALLACVIGVYIARLVLFFPHTPPMEYNKDALLPRVWRLASE